MGLFGPSRELKRLLHEHLSVPYSDTHEDMVASGEVMIRLYMKAAQEGYDAERLIEAERARRINFS